MIATHNGAQTLPVVLGAYVGLDVPDGGWNVVIVDNASVDGTKDVIGSFARRLPLTYVYEPRLGKNQALNAGLSAVSGDLIVFTDDDIVPRRDWLTQFQMAADVQRGFDVFAGAIVPRWPRPPDRWIFALVPLGVVYGVNGIRPSGPVGRHEVFGANMAVRKSIFDLGYRFNTSIGPRGLHYAQGSEAELTQRLERAGHRAWFCSEAVVEHLIRPHQLDERWILQRARRYGRGTARLDSGSLRGCLVVRLNAFIRVVLHLLVQAARVVVAWARRDQEALFRARWAWNYLLGHTEEAWRGLLRPLR